MGARGSKAKKAKAKARPRARDVLAAPAPARRPSRSSAGPTSGDRVASERRASSSAFDEIDHLGDADDRDDVVVGRRPSRGRGSRGARGGARGDDRVRPPVAAWGGADDAPTDLLGGELGIADDDGAPPLAPRPGWCASRDDDAPAAETDDDANAATKWQRRKEEERRRREDKRVAAQQRQSKRQPPTTLRRRTSASSTGSGDPLDLLSPRSAIMHLDDVPLSDFDDADDEGGGEGGRMRPSSGKFTPAKNQPPDDGLTPMERAMKRAAEHRAAREADAAAAAAAAAEEHDGGGFGGREREEPYEMPRRGGGGGGARDAEAAPAARAAALEARAVELERKLAEVTRQADEAMMRAEDAERRAMRAEARAAVAGGGGAAAVAAARAGGLPPPPSWLATPRADDEDELPAYGRRVNCPSSRESPKPSSPAKEAFKLDEALDDVLKRAAKNGSSLEDMLSVLTARQSAVARRAGGSANGKSPPHVQREPARASAPAPAPVGGGVRRGLYDRVNGGGGGGEREDRFGFDKLVREPGFGMEADARYRDDAPPPAPRARGGRASAPGGMGDAIGLGGGDGAAVGAIGDMSKEVARMKKMTKQSIDKERAMLDSLNALRRARDASETRVRDLARELQEAQKDTKAWEVEERSAMRRVDDNSRGGRLSLRDLPNGGVGAGAGIQEASTPRPQERAGSAYGAKLERFSASDDGTESDGGLTDRSDASLASARRHGEHPVFSKIRHGRVDAVGVMLGERGDFDASARDRFGNTPLIVACQNNRKRITKLCVKAGIPLDAVNAQGNSALHYCYSYGYFELGEYLVTKGANPEVTNAAGLTPRETLSEDQLRLLEKTRAEVARKRSGAGRGGAGAGAGGARRVTPGESGTDYSMSSGGESDASGDGGGDLDSYRELYSARG